MLAMLGRALWKHFRSTRLPRNKNGATVTQHKRNKNGGMERERTASGALIFHRF